MHVFSELFLALFVSLVLKVLAYAVKEDDGGAFLRKATDSVKAYAVRILADPIDAGEATLMTDMLNYGAAAQIYFNYNTTALATDGVSLGTPSSVSLSAGSGMDGSAWPRKYLPADWSLR